MALDGIVLHAQTHTYKVNMQTDITHKDTSLSTVSNCPRTVLTFQTMGSEKEPLDFP